MIDLMGQHMMQHPAQRDLLMAYHAHRFWILTSTQIRYCPGPDGIMLRKEPGERAFWRDRPLPGVLVGSVGKQRLSLLRRALLTGGGLVPPGGFDIGDMQDNGSGAM